MSESRRSEPEGGESGKGALKNVSGNTYVGEIELSTDCKKKNKK
jgi:hypothetical protein